MSEVFCSFCGQPEDDLFMSKVTKDMICVKCVKHVDEIFNKSPEELEEMSGQRIYLLSEFKNIEVELE